MTTVAASSLTGCEMPRFLEVLIENLSEIEKVRLFYSSVSSPIQLEPSLTDVERNVVSQALRTREQIKLPFWDSLFLNISTNPTSIPNVVKRAAFHNPQANDSFLVRRAEFNELCLREAMRLLPPNRVLAISSRVVTQKGKTMHLPMLDFQCEASPRADSVVRSVVHELGASGYVAKSGRSYHFYGDSLVDEAALIDLLAKSLLFCPIVDRAWVAHQLIERACGLRISAGKNYRSCPVIAFQV